MFYAPLARHYAPARFLAPRATQACRAYAFSPRRYALYFCCCSYAAYACAFFTPFALRGDIVLARWR